MMNLQRIFFVVNCIRLIRCRQIQDSGLFGFSLSKLLNQTVFADKTRIAKISAKAEFLPMKVIHVKITRFYSHKSKFMTFRQK